MEWKIEVLFIGDYEEEYDDDIVQMESDQKLFAKAIEQAIQETNIIPSIDDWITPDEKIYDVGRISSRDFYPKRKTIRFEIE